MCTGWKISTTDLLASLSGSRHGNNLSSLSFLIFTCNTMLRILDSASLCILFCPRFIACPLDNLCQACNYVFNCQLTILENDSFLLKVLSLHMIGLWQASNFLSSWVESSSAAQTIGFIYIFTAFHKTVGFSHFGKIELGFQYNSHVA